jgi:hypothetical protein
MSFLDRFPSILNSTSGRTISQSLKDYLRDGPIVLESTNFYGVLKYPISSFNKYSFDITKDLNSLITRYALPRIKKTKVKIRDDGRELHLNQYDCILEIITISPRELLERYRITAITKEGSDCTIDINKRGKLIINDLHDMEFIYVSTYYSANYTPYSTSEYITFEISDSTDIKL